jgi:hypothetical protein
VRWWLKQNKPVIPSQIQGMICLEQMLPERYYLFNLLSAVYLGCTFALFNEFAITLKKKIVVSCILNGTEFCAYACHHLLLNVKKVY